MNIEIPEPLVVWSERHSEDCKSHATAGEHYTYYYTPSGIVDVYGVKCLVCGKKREMYLD